MESTSMAQVQYYETNSMDVFIMIEIKHETDLTRSAANLLSSSFTL